VLKVWSFGSEQGIRRDFQVIAALDFMRSQACTAFLPGASREPVAGVRDQEKIFSKKFFCRKEFLDPG
jgi:hypothetical protein